MDRRRTIKRPAPSEEIQCWQNICASLEHLRSLSSNPATTDTVSRVNKLITTFPTSEALLDSPEIFKHSHKKLQNGFTDIKNAADQETKAIDEALEQVGILLALRQAPEAPPPVEKRAKRQRMSSPSSTPSTPHGTGPPPLNTISARSSLGPPAVTAPYSREPRARREALQHQLPLQPGRKVAFRQPPSKGGAQQGKADHSVDGDGETWILAVVMRSINQDKNRYEVQDVDEAEDGQPGQVYKTTLRNLIPLPDPDAPLGSASHPSAYEEFSPGAVVMGLYPDTSCFYRAIVQSVQKDPHPAPRGSAAKTTAGYRVKFEDDDDEVRPVQAEFVVEWPGPG